MDTSIFDDKNVAPWESTLTDALGDSYVLWKSIRDYVYQKYPKTVEEWKFPGVKYGWSFWLKDKKRVILYLLPRDKYFKISMVFGKKAIAEIMLTDISVEIKELLVAAKVYAEGCGIRIDVRDDKNLTDIRKLIDIKLQ
jgi:hypothetical protein